MKKLLIALLWLPLVALAQTYPSPTFQNTTILGTLTAPGATFTAPLSIASGGTNCASASGTCLDNITGFSGAGLISRTGAGTYSFTANVPVTLGGTNLSTLTAHGVLLGEGTSSVSFAVPGTANYALISNGPTSDPSFQQLTAAMVNYTAPITGSVTRTQQAKNADVISVMDTGADPTCTTDSAPAFRQAMADVAYGGEIDIPKGCYLLNSAVNNAILDFTPFPNKGINWKGQGWTLKTGGSFSFGTGTGPSGSILRIGSSINTTTDFYHQAPTDLVIGGVSFKDFAVVANTGAYGTAYGRHGFFFDGTAATNGYIENLQIDNVFVDNMSTGYSIYVDGAGNAQGVLAGADIKNSKFMQFDAVDLGDSDVIERNVIGADAINDSRNFGIYFFNVSGATNTRILNNDIVSSNGDIIVDGSTKAIIDGNEAELDTTNTLGAMIYFRGSDGQNDTPTITNNSIAQNEAGQTYSLIDLGWSNGARISGNRLSVPSTYAPITIAGNASYALVDADNQEWVNGVAQPATQVSDSGVKNMLRGQPWTSFTPTVSAGSGTFGSVSALGRYQLIGNKTIHIQYDITINTVGTASGTVNVTLPSGFTAAAYQTFEGKEVASTGDGLSAYIATSGSTLFITNAAGAPIIGAGYHLVLNGTIEVQ